MTEWITAAEALSRLGVRPQTLYAYVSRGRVRAEADPNEPRRSRYRASDIAALATRRARGRRAADVAQGAIAWGEPVLASSITTVAAGRLFYRGHDAAHLAEKETLEYVARLLRDGLAAPLDAVSRPPPGASIRARAFAVLAQRAVVEPPAGGRHAPELDVEAATLLDIFANAICGEAEEGPIHERFGRAWRVRREDWDLIRRALVLLADHELNASTFAARVTASTGASLAASALAGLSALSGPLHGGMAARVEDFAGEAARSGLGKALHRCRASGVPVPGFGHALYPDGDPRAAALLGAFEPPAALALLRDEVEATTGDAPNVDFALVALTQQLGLPDDAPFALFAAARCAGWIAHAMEQLATGTLIRPRARYVGVPPKLAP